MSALRLRPATFLRPITVSPLSHSFHTSRVLTAGKESNLHTDKTGTQREAEKQESLKKQQQGRGEWDDSLSSDSESIVKADRGEHKADKSSISELQKETAKRAEQEGKGQ